MIARTHPAVRAAVLAALGLLFAPGARADVVTDANARAAAIAANLRPTPVAVRAMAIVQVSVFDALQSMGGPYRPLVAKSPAAPGASANAAVAAATRTALLALLPSQREAIEADYQAELAPIPDGPARRDGISAGEKAATDVLAACATDRADAAEAYRPRAAPGVYVPTMLPVMSRWGGRRPWFMRTGREFRPGPPPALDSATWRHDLAESAALGALRSTVRTAEQTAAARFWEATTPAVYWPLAREVAQARAADPNASARLLAQAAIAMDDAMIAVFDAKYAYEFWRPITAIRNGPDGVRDSTWEPMIETPMHPEYPCAHCIVSASLAAVLAASLGDGPAPRLSSTSPTAGGAERSWATLAEFVTDVSEARIAAGVHFRNSTEVGREMGQGIGALVVRRFPEVAR